MLRGVSAWRIMAVEAAAWTRVVRAGLIPIVETRRLAGKAVSGRTCVRFEAVISCSTNQLTSRWSRHRGGPLSRPAYRSVYRDSLGAAQRERYVGKPLEGVLMNMRRWLLKGASVMFVAMTMSCGGGGSSSSPAQSAGPPQVREWYSGGTLHATTVREWRTATDENRLATSADFVMTLGQYQALPPDLRQRAEGFAKCISEAVEGGSVDDRPVSEIGATCGVLLGY